MRYHLYSLSAKTWLSLYFISFLFIWGGFLPFWGIWLETQGVSTEDIGILFSIGLVLRFVSNLSLLPNISRGSSLLRLLRTLGLLIFISFSVLFFLQGEFIWALITLLVNFLMAPMMPLGDIIGTRLVKQINLDYGRVRLWGSISFIAGSTCVGWLIVEYGKHAILWCIVCATVIMWLLSLLNLSPQLKEQSNSASDPKQSLFSLLKYKNVWLFLLISGAIQGSHGAYYAFSAIYWSHQGISEVSIAWLWGIAVFAEILLMRFNQKLFSHWSIKHMMLLGVIAAIIRWLALGLTTDVYLLALVQTFHAFTFAATHLAAIRYIGLQQENDMVRYQSLYSGIALGLIMALFTYISGMLFESLQGDVFLIISLLLLPILYCIKIWRIPASQ